MRFVPTPTFDDAWADAARSIVLVDLPSWPAVQSRHAYKQDPYIAPTLDLNVAFHVRPAGTSGCSATTLRRCPPADSWAGTPASGRPPARCSHPAAGSAGTAPSRPHSALDGGNGLISRAPEAANELGLRSVAFEVDDLVALVEQLAEGGYHLVGRIGEYEGTWRMAYVRGPEGIIVALAKRLG